MLRCSQFFIIGHQWNIANKRGCYDHPVDRVSRKRISELTGALGDVIIDNDELEGFRKLAKAYGAVTDKHLSKLLADKDLTEICNGDKAKI